MGIRKRDKIAQQQAAVQAEAERRKQQIKMQDATAKVKKREDHWKVTREDMEKKVAENEVDPNYDPLTGVRQDMSDMNESDDNSEDEVYSGRIGGDKTLANAKKKHKKKKKNKK